MSDGGPISRRDAISALGVGVGVAVSPLPAGDARGAGSSGDGRTAVRATVGYSSPAGERAARDRAHTVIYRFGFDAVTVVLDARDVDVLRRREDVRYVERDGIYTIAAQSVPWGIDRVDADVVHGGGETGAGVDIAIIDTGIVRNHEDLQANLGEGAAFTGGTQHNQWGDDNGHGSHVAGTAAALDNDTGVIGVAPDATLHAVKVLTAPGAGLSSDVAKGIDWVADKGYDVGNLSLTGDHLKSVEEACERAADRGVTLVGAAGNNGQCENCVRHPAAYSTVIAVSATNQNDDLANFSSQGPEVEIAAPGANIRSTDLTGYTTRDGTSMACPHVAGTAGLLAVHGYSNEEIRGIVTDTAEDVGLSDNESGAGLLDTESALAQSADGGGGSTPTATDTPTPSPTPTATETSTPSPTPTRTETPTPSPSPTATETSTPSPTPTRTDRPTPSPTPTWTDTPPSTPPSTGPDTPTPSRTLPTTETATPGSSPRPRSGKVSENLSTFLQRIGAGIGAVFEGFADALTGLIP